MDTTQMEVSTILDHIDSGHMALPTFQRGYVWKRNHVRELMDSLYRRHPVGSLLVWVTPSDNVSHRGSQDLTAGVVQLLLDGQQRMTSLYGIIRGTPPSFFDGDANAFTGLHFHLQNEEFRFHQPAVMNDDPLWIDVSALMQRGNDGVGEHIARLAQVEIPQTDIGYLYGRISRLLGIRDVKFHADAVTGEDKTVEVVVDIFNRVNSGGTKLSQGDLALAKISGSWPDAREVFKAKLAKWKKRDYEFDIPWLLRNVNAIVTGEARFMHLHNETTASIQSGLDRAEHSIDYALNLIANRLGLDYGGVIKAPYALPVMSRYIDQRGGRITDGVESDRLIYWYFLGAMRGYFSGSIESKLDQDFETIKEADGAIDRLIEKLHLAYNSRIEPAHFGGSNVSDLFHTVLYAMTRVGEARDWGSPWDPLKKHALGKMSRLELHHIFPKSRLYDADYKRSEVNAVANFCFLTKETNLKIGARLPSDYFREIRDNCPGALESQWIPMDEELWEIQNYPRFLEERRKLLADAANALLDSLRHDATAPEADAAPVSQPVMEVPGGIESEEEETILAGVREWVSEHSLAEGQVEYGLTHPETGERLAVLDLAWPDGLQEGLTKPVALLLDEEAATLQVVVNDHRFRPFTSIDAFKRYVETDVLALDET